MEIRYGLNKNFVAQLHKAKEKYGDRILDFNGIGEKQLGYTEFIDTFIKTKTTTADAESGIDANSNVSTLDMSTLLSEMFKPQQKLLSLNKIYNDTYTVLNPSIIGNTTRDALQRFHHDVLKVNSDIIYIQFGMNDCNIWDDCNGVERVLPETFKSNLIELYTNAIAFGVKKIIFGTNHTSKKNTDYDLRNKEYNNIKTNLFF